MKGESGKGRRPFTSTEKGTPVLKTYVENNHHRPLSLGRPTRNRDTPTHNGSEPETCSSMAQSHRIHSTKYPRKKGRESRPNTTAKPRALKEEQEKRGVGAGVTFEGPRAWVYQETREGCAGGGKNTDTMDRKSGWTQCERLFKMQDVWTERAAGERRVGRHRQA